DRSYRYIPDLPPKDLESLIERYSSRLQMRRSPDGLDIWLNWAIRSKGDSRYFWYVQATVAKGGETSIGYLIFPKYWRSGIAKESVGAVIHELFKQLGSTSISASIERENLPSIRLVESLGFKLLKTSSDLGDCPLNKDVIYILDRNMRIGVSSQ
ncbi:GNAT family N-acetyltransferase, partial [Fangia hongkongensis]